MKVAVASRLIVVMLLWALCFPLISVGLALAPHIAFATMRAGLAGLLLIAVALLLRRPFPRGVRNWAVLALVGLGSTTLGFIGMFHAAEFVSPGIATVIANVQPILAAVLAHVFLHERLSRKGWAGLALGLTGIVGIALPEMSSAAVGGYVLGIAYITLAAAGVSAGNVGMKLLPDRIDALAAMGVQLLLGALPLALLSALTENWGRIEWSPSFAFVLVALAAFGTSLAFWLWFSTLKQVELNRANAFTFLVPIFGLSIGALIFGERLGWLQVGGAALVVAAIVVVQVHGKSTGRPERVTR